MMDRRPTESEQFEKMLAKIKENTDFRTKMLRACNVCSHFYYLCDHHQGSMDITMEQAKVLTLKMFLYYRSGQYNSGNMLAADYDEFLRAVERLFGKEFTCA